MTVLHSTPIWLNQTMTWLHAQVRNLPPDVENHVACRQTANLDQFPPPRLHALPRGPGWHDVADWALVRLRDRSGAAVSTMAERRWRAFLRATVKSAGARIVHTHFGDAAWEDMPAVRHGGARHVTTFYGYDVNMLPTEDPRWRARYAALFAHVDRVFCEGPHMGRCLVALGCPEHKVRVQHLGIDVDAVRFAPRAWTPGTPLRVLLAATFREKKGLPYAMEALARLRRDVPLEVAVIGDATQEERSQAEKAAILAIVDRENMRPAVRFLGFQPHEVLFQEAYRAHVFLSPSVSAANGDTEGGAPVTLIDLAATGMPIVSTFHCDIPNVVRHGETGLLAPERDVDGLVDGLRWFVEHPDGWRPMLEAGRRHVESEFNAGTQGHRLRALYAECLSGGTEA